MHTCSVYFKGHWCEKILGPMKTEENIFRPELTWCKEHLKLYLPFFYFCNAVQFWRPWDTWKLMKHEMHQMWWKILFDGSHACAVNQLMSSNDAAHGAASISETHFPFVSNAMSQKINIAACQYNTPTVWCFSKANVCDSSVTQMGYSFPLLPL